MYSALSEKEDTSCVCSSHGSGIWKEEKKSSNQLWKKFFRYGISHLGRFGANISSAGTTTCRCNSMEMHGEVTHQTHWFSQLSDRATKPGLKQVVHGEVLVPRNQSWILDGEKINIIKVGKPFILFKCLEISSENDKNLGAAHYLYYCYYCKKPIRIICRQTHNSEPCFTLNLTATVQVDSEFILVRDNI